MGGKKKKKKATSRFGNTHSGQLHRLRSWYIGLGALLEQGSPKLQRESQNKSSREAIKENMAAKKKKKCRNGDVYDDVTTEGRETVTISLTHDHDRWTTKTKKEIKQEA